MKRLIALPAAILGLTIGFGALATPAQANEAPTAVSSDEVSVSSMVTHFLRNSTDQPLKLVGMTDHAGGNGIVKEWNEGIGHVPHIIEPGQTMDVQWVYWLLTGLTDEVQLTYQTADGNNEITVWLKANKAGTSGTSSLKATTTSSHGQITVDIAKVSHVVQPRQVG